MMDGRGNLRAYQVKSDDLEECSPFFGFSAAARAIQIATGLTLLDETVESSDWTATKDTPYCDKQDKSITYTHRLSKTEEEVLDAKNHILECLTLEQISLLKELL